MARRPARPGIRPTLPSMLMLALFAVLAVVVSLDLPEVTDGVRGLADVVAASRSDGATTFFSTVTHLADTVFLLVAAPLAVLAFVAAKRPADGLFIGVSAAFTWGMVELFKRILSIPRPDMEAVIAMPGNMSFPSGHSATGLVFYAALALVISAMLLDRDGMELAQDVDEFTASKAVPLWKGVLALAIQLVAVIVIALIGASRVYLGVHWVTDVLGGWILGGAVIAAMSAWWGTARAAQKTAAPAG